MRFALTFLASGAFLALPLVASAEFLGPIVPACGRTMVPCTACDLVQLAENILRAFVTLSVMAATLMFAYAGFLYVTAASSQQNLESAKKIFWNVLLGLIFVLAAFLIVDLVLRTFTGSDFNLLTRIRCVTTTGVGATTTYTPNDNTTSGVESPTDSGGGEGGGGLTEDGMYRLPTQVCNSTETCQRLDPSIQCKEGVCYCTPELCQKLGLLKQNYDGEWQITEDSVSSFGGHGRTCHGNGTCGDLNFTGRLKTLSDKMAAGTATPAEIDELAAGIKKFQQSGEQSGLNLQYEVATAAQREELIRRGVPPDQVIAYAGQSAFHFSYLQCKPANPRNSCPVQSGN